MSRPVPESLRAWPGGTGLIVVMFAVSALLVLGSLVFGLTSVMGLEEGESFQCGSPFFSDNSEGYGGTDGFAACDRTRHRRAALALTGLALGVAVGGYAGQSTRRPRNHARVQ